MRSSAGFGLGLRTEHYADFLAAPQPVDWLEIITDNYLVAGGRPLATLDQLRRDYPMAMHGVAMSIGSSQGVDLHYVRQVKALADRVQPLWISDHLCWIGTGPHQLHDLYPLPYTDEAAQHVITQISRVQDVLQRQLVLENVSSYLAFTSSTQSEWEFLSHVANAADCLLLVDINNIYVSSVNHGFNPQSYLQALPAHRVQQIHLAGHTKADDMLIDTHDQPVPEPVWHLYTQACQLFGKVPTMIERDANIPALHVLLDELERARQLAALHTTPSSLKSLSLKPPSLENTQQQLVSYVLNPCMTPGDQVTQLVRTQPGASPAQRLAVYHHAYRRRLSEALAESFIKTRLLMGSDLFEEVAMTYVVSAPPLTRNLNRYGDDFPAYLRQLYPANRELYELAQLDWDLRTRFDGEDAPHRHVDNTQSSDTEVWLHQKNPLHPSVLLRQIHTNVVTLWKAIDEDHEVPAPEYHDAPLTLMVWRRELQPRFQTLTTAQAAFMHLLAQGESINQACLQLVNTEVLQNPENLGTWLGTWLREGIFGAT